MSEEKKIDPESHPVTAKFKAVLAASGGEIKCDPPEWGLHTSWIETTIWLNGSINAYARVDIRNMEWMENLAIWTERLRTLSEGCLYYWMGPVGKEGGILKFEIKLWKTGNWPGTTCIHNGWNSDME